MTANEHYAKAQALFREYEEKIASVGDELFEPEEALAIQTGLTRILKAAEVQMVMAMFKATTTKATR